jgi:hypothetical protein
VETLNLAGGGRAARLGEQVVDSVFPADPIKEHLDHRVVEPAEQSRQFLGSHRRSCRRQASNRTGV